MRKIMVYTSMFIFAIIVFFGQLPPNASAKSLLTQNNIITPEYSTESWHMEVT